MQKSSWIAIVALAFGFIGCNNHQPETPITESHENVSADETRDFQAEGQKIAMQSYQVMSGELASAMQNGGVKQAVQYCNVHANRITDSLAAFYGATIRRATDRPRNQKNRVNEKETMVLDIWKEKVANGEELKPTVFEDDGEAHFYAPIRVKAQCLNCHGEVGKTMSEKNVKVISALYPEDRATGYKRDDLRGMWHITFKKVTH